MNIYPIITIHNPWASMAATGAMTHLNRPTPMPERQSGHQVIIAASPVIEMGASINRVSCRMTAHALDLVKQSDKLKPHQVMAIGMVTLAYGGSAEECQLDYATGPYCWFFHDSLIFEKPIALHNKMTMLHQSVVDQCHPINASTWMSMQEMALIDQGIAAEVARTGLSPD